MKKEYINEILNNTKLLKRKISEANPLILEKIKLDKNLIFSKIESNIAFILNIFKKENIIDEFKISHPNNFFGIDENILCFHLHKKSSTHYINIITDGENLVIKDSTFVFDFSDIKSKSFVCEKITDTDDYNWSEFAKKLLDIIHKTIYSLEKVAEISMFGARNNVPKMRSLR